MKKLLLIISIFFIVSAITFTFALPNANRFIKKDVIKEKSSSYGIDPSITNGLNSSDINLAIKNFTSPAFNNETKNPAFNNKTRINTSKGYNYLNLFKLGGWIENSEKGYLINGFWITRNSSRNNFIGRIYINSNRRVGYKLIKDKNVSANYLSFILVPLNHVKDKGGKAYLYRKYKKGKFSLFVGNITFITGSNGTIDFSATIPVIEYKLNKKNIQRPKNNESIQKPEKSIGKKGNNPSRKVSFWKKLEFWKRNYNSGKVVESKKSGSTGFLRQLEFWK